jgi:hypothetical protein
MQEIAMTHIVDDGTDMVPKAMLDEAVRIGRAHVGTAARQTQANQVLADGIEAALALMCCGRVQEAYDCLRKASRSAGLKLAS